MAIQYNDRLTYDDACVYFTQVINTVTPEQIQMKTKITESINHVIRLPKYNNLFFKGEYQTTDGFYLPYFPLKRAYLNTVNADEMIEEHWDKCVRDGYTPIDELVSQILDKVKANVLPGVKQSFYNAWIAADRQTLVAILFT